MCMKDVVDFLQLQKFVSTPLKGPSPGFGIANRQVQSIDHIVEPRLLSIKLLQGVKTADISNRSPCAVLFERASLLARESSILCESMQHLTVRQEQICKGLFCCEKFLRFPTRCFNTNWPNQSCYSESRPHAQMPQQCTVCNIANYGM